MPDLKTFSQASTRLFQPGLLSETLIDRSFLFLSSLVPCELIVRGVLHPSGNRLELETDRPHPDFHRSMQAFGSLMSRYPLFCWDPSTNGGKPFRRSDFYTRRQFRQLDVFHEVYQPLGLDNHCAVHVPTGTGDILFYGLERKGGKDFSRRDLLLLEAAQSQLSAAQSLARSFTAAENEAVSPERLQAAGLTPREAQTLHWISQGKSNSEISLLMGIRVDTVKGYITSIFNKSGAGNRFSAIVWARHVCRPFPPRTRSAKKSTTILPRGPSPSEVG